MYHNQNVKKKKKQCQDLYQFFTREYTKCSSYLCHVPDFGSESSAEHI